MHIDPQLGQLWHHRDAQDTGYILTTCANASKEFYDANLDHREIEHQFGRYMNFRGIVDEIKTNKIPGDVIEFGTFQGLSMLMLLQCFAHDTLPRKFIGVDSFEGLPMSSTVWQEGTFNDTSYNHAKSHIYKYFPPNPNFSFELIPGWFSDPHVPIAIYERSGSAALIHFDADLGVSTMQALTIIEPFLVNRVEPMYFLFDDWGCHPDEVPVAFQSWLDRESSKFNLTATEVSSTALTKNFKITFS